MEHAVLPKKIYIYYLELLKIKKKKHINHFSVESVQCVYPNSPVDQKLLASVVTLPYKDKADPISPVFFSLQSAL